MDDAVQQADEAIGSHMTGPQFRAIREKLGLSQIQWGRAIGYAGEPVSIHVCVRRFETMDRVPSQVARLAEMYERHGVPAEYIG